MADLEAVLADVSYLMAMEKSKSTPAARASKKIILPDQRFVFLSCCINNVLSLHYISASQSHIHAAIAYIISRKIFFIL
jgi:hypothetical protein